MLLLLLMERRGEVFVAFYVVFNVMSVNRMELGVVVCVIEATTMIR